MPEIHRASSTKSKVESLVEQRLRSTLGPGMELLCNQPISILFSNKGRGINGYVEKELPRVWDIKEEEHLPFKVPYWPSTHEPLFHIKDGRYIWAIGGRGTKDRTLWSTRSHANQNHLNWVKRICTGDPAAVSFREAYLGSKTEPEMIGKLEDAYEMSLLSLNKRRIGAFLRTEIDYLTVYRKPSGDITPLGAVTTTSPVYGGELDGLTGCGIVDGKLRSSRLFVADSDNAGQMKYRYDSGTIVQPAVDYRVGKFEDKVAVTRDLRLPFVILPYYAATIVGSGTESFMLSDISFYHCHSIARLIKHPRYHKVDWDEKSRIHCMAERSLFGNYFTLLNGMSVNVEIQKIMMKMPDHDGEELSTHLLNDQYIKDRIKKYGYTLEDHFQDMGYSTESTPGIKVTAFHKDWGEDSVEVPLILGFGCSIHHEYDHVMMAGLASRILYNRFNAATISANQ